LPRSPAVHPADPLQVLAGKGASARASSERCGIGLLEGPASECGRLP
jgi:hypothetical protein